MPSIKLTKSVVDTARPTARDYEIRDTIIPGFFCKITPAGRKTFMPLVSHAYRRAPEAGAGHPRPDHRRPGAQTCSGFPRLRPRRSRP